MSVARAAEVLRQTPATLRAMLDGLPEERLTAADAGAWNAAEILRHLIHGEETDWIPRAQIILAHGEAQPFEPFERMPDADGAGASELLRRFAGLRASNLATLEELALGDAELAKTGMHPELGRVTMAQLIATWAAHDLAHIGQIAEVLAKQFRDEVGPWRRYLPIVDRPEEPSS